jgi:hypothetical protein
MKKLLRLAARLYPATWRDRYGVEFQALLEEIDPGWPDIVDVLKGGLQMNLRRVHPAVIAVAVGLVGALIAGVAAFNTADRFVSQGTMSVNTSTPEDVMPRFATALDRNTLTSLIEKYDLYRSERSSSSADEVVHHLRGDIGIEQVSPSVVQGSFTTSDRRNAQQVARDLMSQLIRSNFEGAVRRAAEDRSDGRDAALHQTATSHVGRCRRVRWRSSDRNVDRLPAASRHS